MLPTNVRDFPGLTGTLVDALSASATVARFSRRVTSALAQLEEGGVTYLALSGASTEVVKVTRTGASLVLTRGVDSTAPRKHFPGTDVYWVLAADSVRAKVAELNIGSFSLTTNSGYVEIAGSGVTWSIYAPPPRLRTSPGSRVQFSSADEISLSVEECCEPPLLEIGPPELPIFYLTSTIYPIEAREWLDSSGGVSEVRLINNWNGYSTDSLSAASVTITDVELVELLLRGYANVYLAADTTLPSVELVELLLEGYTTESVDVTASFSVELAEVLIQTTYTPDLMQANASLAGIELV